MTGNTNGQTNAVLKKAIGRMRSIFVYIGLFSFFINALMLVGPIYMMQVYDRVLSSGSLPTLVFLTVAAVGLILTSALLEFVRSRVLVRLGGQLDVQLNETVFSGLLRYALDANGAAQAQPLRDMESLRGFLTGPGLLALFDAPWTPFFLVVIFAFHPLLGFVALTGAVILFGLAVASELATRKPLTESAQQSIGALQFAESTLRNAEVIEAMGMLPGLRRRWLQSHRQALALQAKASDRAGTLTAMAKFVRPVLQVAMLGCGAYLALQQLITPGVMIAASIIMGRALAPVEGAINNWKGLILARGAYRRVNAFVGQTATAAPTMRLPRPIGAISVNRLVAAPPGGRAPVIKGISFHLEPGDVLVIIGPSAAGKSTLARLMIGIWPPSSGDVRLDGADVSTWDHVELGPYLGYLPQDVELFDGSVAENLARFSAPQPEAVVAAARAAGIHEMVLRLEQGYDTPIGEGGAVLSGGQRQRIGLARAIYGNPAFVVLDEPNSNLDGEGEAALNKAILDLKARGTTVVIIAHRPSVLAAADKMLVLRDGMIEAFGSKDEVLPNVTRPVADRAPQRADVPVGVPSGQEAG